MHKPVIWKFNKRKVHSPFIDNIWATDIAYMQLISKFNIGLLTFIAIMHGLFLWMIKKAIQLLMLSKIFLKESNRKPNKIWVGKGDEF